MSKYIFYTLTGRNNNYDLLPQIHHRSLTDRAMFIVLSATIFKKIKGKKPSLVDTAKLWAELAPENYSTFDRSLIRDDLKKLFSDCVEGNIIVDFIVLYELQRKLHDEKNTWSFIAKEITGNHNKEILEILAKITPDSHFCRMIEDIKIKLDILLSRKNIELNGNLFTVNDYCDLEEILSIDFKILNQFIREFNINTFNDNKLEIPIDQLIEEADLIIQQNISIEELLLEKFIPLELEDRVNNYTFKVNKDTSFADLKGYMNLLVKKGMGNYPLLLLGESGSGKSILGLKFCMSALKDNYNAHFINLEKYNNNSLIADLQMEITKSTQKHQDKPFIFFLDGMENLSFIKTKKSFINFLQTILDNSNNVLLISSRDNSQEPDSIINSAILARYAPKIFIKPLQENDKSWIRTPLERVILDEIKGKAKSRGALYYSYIDRSLEKIKLQLPENYSFSRLKADFQEIAFLSSTRGIKIDELKKYNISSDLELILQDNKIIRADKDNFGEITFTNNIFRDFLTAGYLISIDNNNFEKLIKSENLEENKWKYVMIFVAEWLSDNLVQLPQSLFSAALFHLRQQKEFDQVDELINLIPESETEFKLEQDYQLIIEKATSAYYRGKYHDSIKFNLSSLTKIIKLRSFSSLTAKLYNLLASCLNDVYLPSLALTVADIGLEHADEKQKPRLMGNKARSYLKLADFENSEKYFNEKNIINNFLNADEGLRDETDLLLLNAFKYRFLGDQSIPETIILKSANLLQEYHKKEFENDTDDSGNKIYIYRNTSYLLPEITDNEKITAELIDFINKANDLPKKDYGPYGVLPIKFS